MKTFARVSLINIGIYVIYMGIFFATHGEIIGAPVILIHAFVLIVMGIMLRNPTPFISADSAPTDEELKKHEHVRELKQGYIFSGLLILLIGMPLCFVLGAQGFNVQ